MRLPIYDGNGRFHVGIILDIVKLTELGYTSPHWIAINFNCKRHESTLQLSLLADWTKRGHICIFMV